MARPSLVALLALASILMAAALASAKTTVASVEIIEEANAYSRLSCREQVQRQDMRRCEQYLSRRTYRRNDNDIDEEAEAEIEINPYPYSQQEVQQCCRQLRGLDRQCQCEGIRYMVQRQREQAGRLGQREIQQTIQRAQALQSLCGVPQRCDIRAPFSRRNVDA